MPKNSFPTSSSSPIACAGSPHRPLFCTRPESASAPTANPIFLLQPPPFRRIMAPLSSWAARMQSFQPARCPSRATTLNRAPDHPPATTLTAYPMPRVFDNIPTELLPALRDMSRKPARITAQIRTCIQGDWGYDFFRDKPTPNWFVQAADPVATPRKRGGRSCFQEAP
jgi:hypothetical protein